MPVPPRSQPPANTRQPQDEESLLRSIAANTPGIAYDPPSRQLGSYGRGPLGEPTFAPFHPNYVDWLKERAQGAASSDQRQPPAAERRMPYTPRSADGADPAGARKSSSDGHLDLAQNGVSTDEVSADEVHKYYPHPRLKPPVVPPPPSSEELVRQAQRDEIAAKRGQRWANTADDISENSDLDPFDAEYVDHRSGGKWVETIRDGATLAAIILRHDAKLRAERARRAREEARKRPR